MDNVDKTVKSILYVTDLLHGSFKINEYKNIILPFVLLKRLDSMLEYSKLNVLKEYNNYKDKLDNLDPLLKIVAKDEDGNLLNYYNFSQFDFKTLLKNPENIEDNLYFYIDCFSDNVKDIFKNFDMKNQIYELSKKGKLYHLLKRFSEPFIDLSPKTVSNQDMVIIFEELIKRLSQDDEYFAEYSTPKDVVKLVVRLLCCDDIKCNNDDSIKLYDPACGTGEMLRYCKEFITKSDSNIDVLIHGQDINPNCYSIFKSIMLMKGENIDNIKGPSSTLSNNLFKMDNFDYMISHLPYGASWDMDRDSVLTEVQQGFDGRFGAGTPRRNDSQFLFIQDMLSKMKENGEKSKIVVITNSSTLSSGDAGSGENNIRKWIFENDYLESIISLPNKLFFNTGINAYIWILTNKKSDKRKGKVQLIDAREEFTKLNKRNGFKLNFISKINIENIINDYYSFEENDKVKILNNDDFGYSKIIIERPMQFNYQVTNSRLEKVYSSNQFNRLAISKKTNTEEKIKDEINGRLKQEEIKKSLLTISNELYFNWDIFEKQIKNVLEPLDVSSIVVRSIVRNLAEHDDNADYVTDKMGMFKPDPDLRKYEKIPLNKDPEDFLKEEILPQYPDAWIDYNKSGIGYSIKFNEIMFNPNTLFEDNKYLFYPLKNFIEFNTNDNPDLFFNKWNSNKFVYYPYELNNLEKNKYISCNLKSDRILKEYIFYFLNSNKGLNLISKFSNNQFVFNTETIYNILIPVPNIEEQSKIVETARLMESFVNEIEIWKKDYYNNILNYKPTLESYNQFSCSIKFAEDGGISEFCRNWRIVYQGLAWPLAYTYLKATKGSNNKSTKKSNYLVLFEFFAAFNVILLISAINDAENYEKYMKSLWVIYKDNKRTWHRMTFGSWTTLYGRLVKIYRDNFDTSLNREFLNQLSSKKYKNLFNKLRSNERNSDAHSGLEDDIDVNIKLQDLENYMIDIFDILNLYSGLKFYYICPDIRRISPKKVSYKVISLNGPCDPPIWHNLISDKNLEPYCLYFYDSLNGNFLKINSDLMKFRNIPDSKQYGIYIFDGVDERRGVALYKCYQQKNDIWEIPLKTDEDTYFKVSDEFLKEVLRL